MNALSPEESWTLFCKKVFQGNDCPQPLYPLSKRFLEKCDGLPLAIVAMAVFWPQKTGELKSGIWLGEVLKKRLIQLWIAEGFLQVREGKTLEEVAEQYLNNLVNRSLVQVADTTIDGRLKTCRVHDILREMIVIKSREQSIGTIISGHDAKWRCLAIHNSVEKLCYIEAGEIKGSGGSCNIVTEIGKLTQLRRLGITELRRKDGTAFCSSIEKLSNLRSLYVHSVADDEILDVQSLSSAPQFLRTLDLGGRLEKFPQWIPSLHSLVKIWLYHSQLGDDPLQSLEALPNLKEIVLAQAYEGESLTFKAGGFQRLKKLELLQLK
ncbi:hypothetical protein RJ640_027057 [Escallonia rubra]|uniref:NB-ARC domain-containing protein n=1 Tax=Escallonia rubra TaxID=112253 RepID=A0AA88UPX5_9ASTE|nr:hypothetical protein RJ640_027057 [Escallonia rubra]